jgi:hypothetical protein
MEGGRASIQTLVETGTSPLTIRYKFGSKYVWKSSASSELVAGRSSETLTQTVFPAAIAPAWHATQQHAEAREDKEITHERAHQKRDGVIERHEDEYDPLWFLANLRLSTKVDGEPCALWFGPFLKFVKDVLDLLKGDVEFETKPQ